MIRWETTGLFVGQGSLLHCSGLLHLSGGLKRGGFELSGDDAESSVLAAFQLVQSGWGQPGFLRRRRRRRKIGYIYEENHKFSADDKMQGSAP